MTSPVYNLVHANIATARASFDDPLMKDFFERIEEIDALAQNWPGFVAQPALPDEGELFREPTLLNVSIWESIVKLREFTYTSSHANFLKRRAEWFVPSNRPAYVLYWAAAGEIPTEEEIRRRHEHLHHQGATPIAFTFNESFTVEEMLQFKKQNKDRIMDSKPN